MAEPDSSSDSIGDREWSVRRINAYGYKDPGDADRFYRVEWDPSDGRIWDDTWEPKSVFTDYGVLKDFHRRWSNRRIGAFKARENVKGQKGWWYKVSWVDPAGKSEWKDTWEPRHELLKVDRDKVAAYDLRCAEKRSRPAMVPINTNSQFQVGLRGTLQAQAQGQPNAMLPGAPNLPEDSSSHRMINPTTTLPLPPSSNSLKRKRPDDDDGGFEAALPAPKRAALPPPTSITPTPKPSYQVLLPTADVRGPSLGHRASATMQHLAEMCETQLDWDVVYTLHLALLYPLTITTTTDATRYRAFAYEHPAAMDAILVAALNDPQGPFDAVGRVLHAFAGAAAVESAKTASTVPITWDGFRPAWTLLRCRGGKIPSLNPGYDTIAALSPPPVEPSTAFLKGTLVYGMRVYPVSPSTNISSGDSNNDTVTTLAVEVIPPLILAKGNRLLRCVGSSCVLQVYVDAGMVASDPQPEGKGQVQGKSAGEKPDQKRRSIKKSLRTVELAGGVFEFLHFKVVQGDREAVSMRAAATDYGIYLLSAHSSRPAHLPDLLPPWLLLSRHMPPLPRNLSQLTGKFLARLDLWGSSTDAVQLPPDIAIVYDLDDVHPAGNPGEAMTDGAGLVSRRVMEHVCSALGRTGSLPNAMQIRYLGFKGLLVMDRTDELGEVGRTRREELNGRTPDIAFRKSMHKYVSPPEELSQPGTLEVVALTHVSLANLNQQLVNVLECGGVPEEPFRNLVAKATETLIDTFLQPNMIPNAIQALMTQPVSAGLSGFSRLAHNLCAGFDAKEPYIRSKLVDHIQWKLSPMWTSAHIPIQEAGMYTIVPAPKGTLKEGEILVQVPGFTNALAGREVVILRNPAVLPTDGQKLRVADIRDYPQLAGYDDVCMMSVEGDVREASRIAGGDYDGDRAVVIWLKEIVDSFKCQRDVPKTPDDVEESFSQSKEVVKDLVKDHTGEQYGRPLLARGVLEWSTATNAKVGWYTMLWAAAVDKWGMDSPSALRFAHIAARLLDARKNGEFLNSEVEKMHKDFFLKHHKGQPPVWWKTGSSKAKQVAATQPKYARFLHELAAGSDQLLQERVAGLSKATQCPEIIEYFDRDDALFGSDKHWAHDMRLVRDSIFATELPLWAGYWKEELNAKLGPIPTSSAQAAAPENPDVENELTVLKGLTGRDAVMARFRQLFETSPADQELHSLALRGTNGRDRLLKLKAALIYKHSRSSYVWEVCGHELRSILAGSLQGPSLSVAAQFAPLMRLKVESVGFRTGFNVDEVPVEAGMSGIEWTNEGEDV